MTDKELEIIKRIEADFRELARISNTEDYLDACLVNGGFLITSSVYDNQKKIDYYNKEAKKQ